MRGALHPFEKHNKIEIAVRDYIGSNSGNMLYAYSVFRMLSSNGSEVELDHYKVERNVYSDEDIRRINETYVAYILPLADAFRDDFIERLNAYSTFIEKLTIPCIVIGVGIREAYEPQLHRKHLFDSAVVRFVKSVLTKSNIIGVRGGITAEYLKQLGFVEDRDYMVIGCPSFFMYGNKVYQRTVDVSDRDINIAINLGRGYAEHDFTRYTYELSGEYQNYLYIGQEISELRTFVIGMDNLTNSRWYPGNINHKFYAENKVRHYINPENWIKDMEMIDFSIGGRLHGNIAAILGGAPAVLFMVDSRTRELAEYLRIPSLRIDGFNSGQTLEELVEKMDLSSHLKIYADNYTRYIEFLKKNGLSPVQSKEREYSDAIFEDDIKSYAICNKKEKIERQLLYRQEEEVWKVLRTQS